MYGLKPVPFKLTHYQGFGNAEDTNPQEDEALAMRSWPRSIRWQLLAGLVLLEVLSITLFAVLLIREQGQEVHERTLKRLASRGQHPRLAAGPPAGTAARAGWAMSVRTAGDSPNVVFAKVTDPAGNVLFVSRGEPEQATLSRSKSRKSAAETGPGREFSPWEWIVWRARRRSTRQRPARLCLGREQ